MTPIIEIKNLKKYYRSGLRGIGILALDGISLEIPQGAVFGLLGPNGAGKSTTIKILLGLSKQNSGDCLIFGEKMNTHLRSQIGYLPEAPYFHKFLTGFELVRYCARLCGMSKAQAEKASLEALEKVGLADVAHRRIGLYSKGMIQRAGLAQAVVHNPKLVILDEPASGLDPIGAADMAESIRNLQKEGKTVLMSSHIMSEVESLCTHVAILSHGKIAAVGSLDNLLNRDKIANLEIENASKDDILKIAEYAKSLGISTKVSQRAGIPLEEFFRKTVV